MTSQKIENYSAADFCFFIGYAIWLVCQILNTTFLAIYFYAGVMAAIRVATIGMVLIGELIANKYSTKAFVGLVVVMFCSICFIVAGVNNLIDGAILIWCARRISFSKIAKITVAVMTAALLAIILCALIGLIPDYIESSRSRHYLGFLYALYPAQFMLCITSLALWLMKTRVRYTVILILIFANITVFLFTDSRSAFMFALCSILVCVLIVKSDAIRKLFKIIAAPLCSIFLICGIASFVMVLAYDPGISWMNELNAGGLLSGRLSLASNALKEYGISLFGQDIVFVGNGLNAEGLRNVTDQYNYVDCLYIQIGIRYGVIFLALFLILMSLCCLNARKNGDYVLLFILAIIAVHCMIDDLSFQLCFNPFLFSISALLVQKGNSTVSGRLFLE